MREPLEWANARLEMTSAITLDGRIQILEYVPTVPAGPPGADPTPA